MTNAPHPPTRFTAADAKRAHEEWGCNCGPAALAAICGLTLDEVRLLMGDFEAKGYTNPTLMAESLLRARVSWYRRQVRQWPTYGLARIQWTGPWTKPGVPPRVAYRHTHWVGAMRSLQRTGAIGVFDINMIANGTGWAALEDWQSVLVPWLLGECEPKADGGWFITHTIEVERP
ncbi:hypothetical protein [Reyranella sp.]|uniref:hypothetical protein n=1 Tax=Reyranella sp. TaxID=1929291 RepID=UPI003D0D351C